MHEFIGILTLISLFVSSAFVRARADLCVLCVRLWYAIFG
jgi:hypothetical protein